MKRTCTLLLSILTIGILFFLPASANAHGGEDHSGESLATTSGPMLGSPIFVPVETQILVGVKTTPVKRETLPKTLKVLGRTRLRPEFEAVVTSPVEGRLIDTDDYTPPSLGQRVTRGQILAVVDQAISAPETISLASERALLQSDLRQAKADLDLAQKEYDRLTKLKSFVPEKEVIRAEASLVVAREKYEGLKKQASVYESAADQSSSQSANPRRFTLRSPIDGAIARTHVTLGEYVRPEKELFHVVDLSEILVEAEVFENDIAIVSHATGARLVVEAYPDESFTAKFVSIGTSVDMQTRTLRILFSVPNPEGKLVAEMFADVFIETGETAEGLTIPKSAVVNQDGQSVIYVKTSAEQFVARPITVAQKFADRVMIAEETTSSISEGSRVVVQGMYQVRMSASRTAAPAIGEAATVQKPQPGQQSYNQAVSQK